MHHCNAIFVFQCSDYFRMGKVDNHIRKFGRFFNIIKKNSIKFKKDQSLIVKLLNRNFSSYAENLLRFQEQKNIYKDLLSPNKYCKITRIC